MAASSLGLAFSVPEDVDGVLVTASWGRYERRPSGEGQVTETGRPREQRRRVPAGGPVRIPDDTENAGAGSPDGLQERVLVQWRVRHRNRRRVVEVFLLNAQPAGTQLLDRERLFQAQLTVTALDGAAAVFLGHNDPDLPEVRHDLDDELRLLALQHRGHRLYATGRMCAVDAHVRVGETRAWRLRPTCFPAANVQMVVAGDPADTPGLVLDMARLGSPDLQPDDMVRSLRPLVDGYRRWLRKQARRITDDPEVARFADVAGPALQRAQDVADRLDRAVELLREDAQAREAFRFANQAMARQRVRSELVRRRGADPTADVKTLLHALDVPDNRSWRPFQLAFVLLCLPGLTDPAHPDARRGPLLAGQAQLLFFPTGGGKTEAYLGLTAYTIAIRRLQGMIGTGPDARDGTDGLAVLMRYTLRLLTAQQFQRATALICACELLRRERVAGGDLRWGTTPIRIGLWVGAGVTPNTFDDAARQLEDATGRAGEGQVGGLQQFASCPWCGASLDLGRDGHADRLRRRILLFCGDQDGNCPFSRARSSQGLPALVVDEEIYRLTPALLIGTVDKFAALPWRSATAHLFGHVTSTCSRHGYRNPDTAEWCKDGGHPRAGDLPSTRPQPVQRLRPPDLIIQDELHLISDALGSMVGLYETLVDRLSTRIQDGRPVRPVFVASTATVRRAKAQVQQVFARDLAVFPPPLIDAGDTFFSRRVAPGPDSPARRYRGILAPGERLTAVEIRVVTALLEFGQYLFDRHGAARNGAAVDPYMTVVDYFTSTRELAGMRRLTEDDISDRLGRQAALVRRRRPVIAELTSRMDSRKITQSLADLDRRFDPAHDTTTAIDGWAQLRRTNRTEYERTVRPGYLRPVDVLLDDPMLQVASMYNAWLDGRDRAAQEHGRVHPGQLPRRPLQRGTRPGADDLPMEPAPRPGPLRALRLRARNVRPARRGPDHHPVQQTGPGPRPGRRPRRRGPARQRHVTAQPGSPARPARPSGRRRPAGRPSGPGRTRRRLRPGWQEVAERACKQLDRWLHKRQTLPTGQLGYQADTRAAAGLLRKPEEIPWDRWSAPMSLRDVEPEILLQLRRDDPSWTSAPDWDFTPRPPAATGARRRSS
jgi:hypothetical protein